MIILHGIQSPEKDKNQKFNHLPSQQTEQNYSTFKGNKISPITQNVDNQFSILPSFKLFNNSVQQSIL